MVSKSLAQGHKGLTAHRCSFYFYFSPPNALFFVINRTTKLGMKDFFKDQQWRVERDSNLIPLQYRSNALTTNPFAFFNIHCCKTSKNWTVKKFGEKKFPKKFTMPKKLKGVPFGNFQHPFCRKTSKNWRGTLWGKNFGARKKVTMPKKTKRGDSLVFPGMVCYAEKEKKTFLVQFDRPNAILEHKIL